MTAWDFAVRLWARPDVEGACLALQEARGLPPILLLWGLWAAGQSKIDVQMFDRACVLGRAWEDSLLRPLRDLRRGVSGTGADVAAEEAQRRRIVAIERAAERLLLDSLEAGVPAPGGPVLADPEAVLRALIAGFGPPVPARFLRPLIAAVGPCPDGPV